MLTALMLAASLLTAAPAAEQTADLSIDLDARALPFLASVRYTVTVLNNGPDPLTQATVTVQLEQSSAWGVSAPCSLAADRRTITCTIGALPVGGTATASPVIYYMINSLTPITVNATATRTASSPADPNPANDTDTRACQYHGPNPPQQTWPPEMSC